MKARSALSVEEAVRSEVNAAPGKRDSLEEVLVKKKVEINVLASQLQLLEGAQKTLEGELDDNKIFLILVLKEKGLISLNCCVDGKEDYCINCDMEGFPVCNKESEAE